MLKKIGLLVAVELKALKRKYGEPYKTDSYVGYEVLRYRMDGWECYAVHTGAGEIAAAAGTQLLISVYHVDMILNFGVVGALTEEMTHHRICVVKEVVHYDFDTSVADGCEVGRYLEYPTIYIPTTESLWQDAVKQNINLKPVVCASADKFIETAEKKQELHRIFKADICEMEAAGIVLTCNRNRVPCLLIKMVADGLEGGLEEFKKEFHTSSDICLEVMTGVVHDFVEQQNRRNKDR